MGEGGVQGAEDFGLAVRRSHLLEISATPTPLGRHGLARAWKQRYSKRALDPTQLNSNLQKNRKGTNDYECK